MTAPALRGEIDRLLTALWSGGLVVDTNAVVMTQDLGLNWVSWAGSGHGGMVEDSTKDEYLRLVRERQFTGLLRDGAIVQISAAFRRDELVKHRYVYHPCPLPFPPEGLDDVGILDYFDLLGEDLAASLLLSGPVRFDYDADAAAPGHPSAHVTLVRSECRIPVFSPLSLGHFVRTIFSSFYPEIWTAHPFLRWPLDWHARTITAAEQRHLHVECLREL